MKNSKLLKQMLAGPYLLWSAAFIIIPLIMVFYYGLTNNDGGFTLMNLARITEPENLKALGLALLLSLVSTIICLILAYPLAMILTGLGVNQSSFIVLIFILPMWMNSLLRIIAWQNLLEKNGVINSLLHFFHLPALEIINTPYAIVLGMVYDFLPFMILPIYNVLSKIDSKCYRSSQRSWCKQCADIYKNPAATERSRDHQRNYHGLCTVTDNFCHLRPLRWK